MGNLVGVDPDQAGNEWIGRKVKIGCREIPPANYTAGEGVAITFEPIRWALSAA